MLRQPTIALTLCEKSRSGLPPVFVGTGPCGEVQKIKDDIANKKDYSPSFFENLTLINNLEEGYLHSFNYSTELGTDHETFYLCYPIDSNGGELKVFPSIKRIYDQNSFCISERAGWHTMELYMVCPRGEQGLDVINYKVYEFKNPSTIEGRFSFDTESHLTPPEKEI